MSTVAPVSPPVFNTDKYKAFSYLFSPLLYPSTLYSFLLSSPQLYSTLLSYTVLYSKTSQLRHVPSRVRAPTTWPTPPSEMNSFLADCLLASMERAGQPNSHTPTLIRTVRGGGSDARYCEERRGMWIKERVRIKRGRKQKRLMANSGRRRLIK